MLFKERHPTIIVIGGGSGPISIEDELLNRTPHVLGITGVHDNGGHSGEIRSTIGGCAVGDFTHRVTARLRDPILRQIFLHRWNIEGNSNLNGHRPSNEMMAGAQFITKNHIEAANSIQRMLNPKYYRGWVYPVTDESIHLRAILADGTNLDCEDKIDQRNTNKPEILDIDLVNCDFKPCTPKLNPEIISIIPQADAIIISGSSFITSTLPILRTPDFCGVIRESNVPVIWFCNAFTNFNETDGYTTSQFARKLYRELGKKIDYAFVNIFNHDIPPSYNEEKSYPVLTDIGYCYPFIKRIYNLPLTEVVNIEGKQVVRHDGKVCSELIMNVINYERSRKSLYGKLRYVVNKYNPHTSLNPLDLETA